MLRKHNDQKRPTVLTLVVRGTGDQSITSADKNTFGGVAEIFEESAKTYWARFLQVRSRG